jgi:PAS domain S-box-containing protein
MKQTILVVDDSSIARSLLKEILSEEGYEVILAESGLEMLSSLKSRLPDLILLDIHLGDMNGLEVCKLIKADSKTKDIPIILISGTANAHEWAQGLQLGAVDCILKPFNSMELVVRIHAHLALSQTNKLLKQTETRLQLLSDTIDITPEGIYWVDIEGRFIYANSSAYTMLGYTLEELQKLRVCDINLNMTSKRWKQFWEVLRVKKNVNQESVHYRRDGSAFPVEVSTTYIRFGEDEYINGFVRDITKRKQIEESLQASEHQLQTFISNAPTAIAMFDRELHYLAYSERWLEDYGLTDQNLIGKHHYDIFPSIRANEFWIEVHKRCLAGEDIKKDEDHFIGLDGKQEWLRWNVCPWRLSDGSVGGIIMLTESITARKLAEKTLKESEERSRIFFERQLVGMAITSTTKGWLQVNARICEMLGYSEEELKKLTWAELTYPDDLVADNAQFARLLKGEIDDYTIEKRFVRKDAKIVYTNLAVACVRTSNGSVDYVLALVEDITKRKQAEQELRIAKEKVEESERTLRAIYENSQDAIVITQNSEIAMVNQAYLDLLGFEDKDEVIGKSFINNISPKEHERIKQLHQKRNTGAEAPNFYETLGIRKNGEEFPFDVKVGMFEINNQKFTIAIVRDISDRKKSELELERHRNKLEELVQERTLDLIDTIQRLKETQSQLIQSEKLASLGILTAGIAHEINNPINYINSSILSLEMLANELIDIIKTYETITPENIQEKLKEIKESMNLSDTIEGVTVLSNNIKVGAKKTADIVKSLRIFSRSDSDIPILSDINENIDSTLILLHNQYNDRIKIIKNYERIPLVNCYPGKLNQVFMNLLANAIQAIEDQGTITIKTLHMPSGFPDFKKECIFISIRDTGKGIPLEIRNKVFEPFFTTKEIGKGTGLGLSISYGIIEQHKGKMEFTSSVVKGTEFKLYLPL